MRIRRIIIAAGLALGLGAGTLTGAAIADGHDRDRDHGISWKRVCVTEFNLDHVWFKDFVRVDKGHVLKIKNKDGDKIKVLVNGERRAVLAEGESYTVKAPPWRAKYVLLKVLHRSTKAFGTKVLTEDRAPCKFFRDGQYGDTNDDNAPPPDADPTTSPDAAPTTPSDGDASGGPSTTEAPLNDGR